MEKFTITELPRCPHCGMVNVAMYLQCVHYPKWEDFVLSFWTCGHCQHGLCIESLGFNANSSNSIIDMLRMYPDSSFASAPEHTPEMIAADYTDAKTQLMACQYKSSALMARIVLESTVKHMKAQGRDLKSKINDLTQKHIITDSLSEWANTLRIIGNEAAHDMGEVSQQDAEQAVYFAEMLLTYIFTLPGMIANRQTSC